MIGFNYRRVPALALAKELIAEGRLGTVRHVRAAYLQDWLSDAEAPMTWRLRKETAGSGALGDIASHAIDQILYLLGTPSPRRPALADLRHQPPRRRKAWRTSRSTTLPGPPSGLRGGRLRRGSRVATGQKNSLRLEIYGDKGALPFDLEALNELGSWTPPPGPGAGLPPDPGQRTRTPLPGRRGGRRATSSAGSTPSPTRSGTS